MATRRGKASTTEPSASAADLSSVHPVAAEEDGEEYDISIVSSLYVLGFLNVSARVGRW